MKSMIVRATCVLAALAMTTAWAWDPEEVEEVGHGLPGRGPHPLEGRDGREADHRIRVGQDLDKGREAPGILAAGVAQGGRGQEAHARVGVCHVLDAVLHGRVRAKALQLLLLLGDAACGEGRQGHENGGSGYRPNHETSPTRARTDS